jgi:hypothetical protein
MLNKKKLLDRTPKKNMDTYPSLEELDTLIDTLHDINTTKEDVLVPVPIQKALNVPAEEKFEKSFVSPTIARKIHSETMERARVVLSRFNIDYHCQTLPPLFVRCDCPEDISIPVSILFDGELLVEPSQVPDLILHFFAKTGAILVSLCRIDETKMNDYWIVQKTLFKMEAKQGLTVEQFGKLYDSVRYAVLRFPI